MNKLSDCAQEAAETQTWLEFSLRCGYLTPDIFNHYDDKYEHIYAMLFNMEKKVDSFFL